MIRYKYKVQGVYIGHYFCTIYSYNIKKTYFKLHALNQKKTHIFGVECNQTQTPIRLSYPSLPSILPMCPRSPGKH